MGHPTHVKSREGAQCKNSPRWRNRPCNAPRRKLRSPARSTCGTPVPKPGRTAAPAPPRGSALPGVALTQAQSRCARVPVRMLRGAAALPAGGGCSGGGGGGGSSRFASTPVAAWRSGTASSGRSAGSAAAARLSQDHGVAEGAGGPGSPGGKNPPLPDSPGSWERAEPTERPAEWARAAFGAPRPLPQVCPRRGALALCAGGPSRSPSLGRGGDKLQAAPGSPGTEAVFSSPVASSTQPQAPWGSGSRLSRSPGQCAPNPGAAGLASRPGAAAPWSHETRAGTVRARVVQRAVTLWRLPPPHGARGVPTAGLTRLGVCRECCPTHPAPDPGNRSLEAVRALGGVREATRCPVGPCGRAECLAEAWLLLQSIAGTFPYRGVCY